MLSKLSSEKSIDAGLAAIREKIKEGDLNEALKGVQHVVNYVFTEPLCTARIFSSPQLDNLCAQIGLAALARAEPEKNLSVVEGDRADTAIFVASRLQSAGGHTRVIEDFIRILPHKNKYMLVTELVGGSDRSDAENRFGYAGRID